MKKIYISIQFIITILLLSCGSNNNQSGKVLTNSQIEKLNSNFRVAAGEGQLNQVKSLLKQGADVNSRAPSSGNVPGGGTALMLAVGNNQTEIVEYLILNGADVNIADEGGGTALIYATWVGNKKIVEILLNKGAGVNAMTKDGRSAISIAQNNNFQEIQKLLQTKQKESQESILSTNENSNKTERKNNVLEDNLYKDPNGYFSILPPFEWKAENYPDDPRGKVAFFGPEKIELRILAKGVDYDNFDKMYSVILNIEKSNNIKSSKEKIIFCDKTALKRVLTYGSLKIMFIDVMIGNVSHNIMYSAQPAIFDKYLILIWSSLNTYDPILKGVTPDEMKQHSIAKCIRLSKIFIENKNYNLAMDFVMQGLLEDENNFELIELKKSIESLSQ